MSNTRASEWVRAGGAALALLGMIAGVPLLLIKFIGNPWPATGVHLMKPMSDEVVLGILGVVAWAFWAQLVVCVLFEVAGSIRGASLPTRSGVRGWQQNLARNLVTAVLAVAATSSVAGSALVSTTTTTVQPAPDSQSIVDPSDLAPAAASLQEGAQRNDAGVTVVVRRGDTLWSLAAKHLGDGGAYRQIVELNDGHTMIDDRTFRSADPLVPGWELVMPARSTGLEDPASTATRQDLQVTVDPGDSLSKIAQDQYGNGSKWPKIFKANQGERFNDGRTFSDPDLIQPGWKLEVPAEAGMSAAEKAPAEKAQAGPVPAESQPDVAQHAPAQHAPAQQGAPAASATETAPEAGGAGSRLRSARNTPQTAVDAGGGPEQEGSQVPGWIMPGLLGAGTFLAGSLLLALRRRRASEHRVRRPGRTLTAPDPQLWVTEKSITVAGATAATTVELVDELLKRLATSLSDRGDDMPSLAAVEVTAGAVAIHLRDSAPSSPGAPWVVSDDGMLWVVDKNVDLDTVGLAPADSPAPWPLLITIGQDDQGAVWLLNIEDLNVNVTGDPVAAADFARFLAAEVVCNPWSKHTALDLVGIAGEVAPISPDRIHAHDHSATAAAVAVAEAVHTIDRLTEQNLDTPTARARQDDPDTWPSRLVIADHFEGAAELTQLVDLVSDHRGRTATAVVLSGLDDVDGFEICIDDLRHMWIPSVNLSVAAVGLTVDETHGCAALLAQADQQADSPPSDLSGDTPWQLLATSTGSLRDQYRISRSAITLEPSSSLLEEPDDEYTSVAATTSDDLAALAPKVTETVRRQVADADPTLDADLDAWSSENCARPRLTLLGPVGARTSGAALDRRKPFYTELFAFLATRPYGATNDEVATAFDLTPGRVRTDIKVLRDWLGIIPATGERFLPDARTAPAAQERGVGVYEVVGALVDADLFRRLRVRGETRGAEGIGDLVRALQLVKGRPFEKLRDGGWGWLMEGGRDDQHLVCAIADVAHVVVTHSLHAGDLDRGRTAAGIAMMAASDEEVTRLDLAAVLEAQGHSSEAERIVREDVCNRSDDGGAPTELTDRTEQVIDARRWLHRAAI